MGSREAIFIDELCDWFDINARDLPWRRKRTAYRALVAEFMLQQTQVQRVQGRYQAFLRRFPTVRSLAEAHEQSVLVMWQGLGYYRRARNLHAAAKMIVDQFKGKVPRTTEGLIQLPGVGRYTAGAIASIVFGLKEPIVDGNVKRVLARFDALEGELRDHEKRFWTRAGELVKQAERPGVFNEALMELGAIVCTKGQPKCSSCPVADLCKARRTGKQDEIPKPARPAPRMTVHHHAVIVRRGKKILLERRPERGLWSNMWQPPTVEADRALTPHAIRKTLALPLEGMSKKRTFEHQTTHRRVVFHVYEARSKSRRGTWRALNDLSDLPMSNAHRHALELDLITI